MTPRYAKPDILSQIDVDTHTVIQASAGTGKTYTIEHMVVELLLSGRASLDQVLVLTYTEKAAGDLRRKVRERIGKLLSLENDEGLDSAAVKQWGQAPRQEQTVPGERASARRTSPLSHSLSAEKPFWEIDEMARERLARAWHDFDRAPIGTIHGFFGRVLGDNAFDGGQLFTGELQDGRTLFGRAFKTTLRHDLAKRDRPEAELLAAWLDVTNEGVDALEKLLYDCHKSGRQIEPPYDPATMQALITRLLAGLNKATIQQLDMAWKKSGIHHSTRRAAVERLSAAVQILETHSQHQSLVRTITSIQDDLKGRFEKRNTLFAALEAGSHREAYQAYLTLATISLHVAVVQSFLPRVRDTLRSMKSLSGAFDFDDIIQHVVAAVCSLDENRPPSPTAERLAASLCERFNYALIDESQDTDQNQWRFFERVFVKARTNNPIFLIGDPKQAIYSFRGADVNTYLKASKTIPKKASLATCYRSTPALIAAFNAFFDQGDEQHFFTYEEIRYDNPVGCGKRGLEIVGPDQESVTPIHVFQLEPGEEGLKADQLRRVLADRIAREVKQLCDRPFQFTNEKGELAPIEPKDIYVLTATNDEGDQIGEALRALGVPHAFYKREGLFQTTEAREILAVLRAIADPDDRPLRAQAWITRFFAVPLEALPALEDLDESHPLIDRLVQWSQLSRRGQLAALFGKLLEDSGIVRRELLLEETERSLTNYLHIFEVLLEEARTRAADLDAVIATLDAYIRETRLPSGEDGNIQRLDTENAAVKIMTIHKSKGLEAAVVFLFGGFGQRKGDGTHSYTDGDRRVLYIGNDDAAKLKAEQERRHEYERLYYVALTRAKARLYLPHLSGDLTKKCDGGYACVNARLSRMLASADLAGQYFQVETVNAERATVGPAQWPEKTAETTDGSIWEHLPESPRDAADAEFFNTLAKQHAAFIVTSYSRMRRHWGAAMSPLEADEIDREQPPEEDSATLVADDLPGGSNVGKFLHEIIDEVVSASLVTETNVETWRVKPEICELFEKALARFGVSASHRPRAEAIVFQALTSEFPIGDGGAISGLGRCDRVRSEVEFLFPVPEAAHPSLERAIVEQEGEPKNLVIERGYIKGFVDLIVAHQGRVFFADWKSDVLPGYDDDLIRSHVEKHYTIQAHLYTLALVKALEVCSATDYKARFGGLFYVFLRGLGPGGAGTYFNRPSWDEVVHYEASLREPGAESGGPR